MDLDALLYHYFGTTDLEALDQNAVDVGIDRVAVAFGTEREAGRRFALWALLHAFGHAPDPRVAFKSPREREAAAMYARAAAGAEQAIDD
ncbi:hypothetical protein U1701_06240 [Sphingomonas sp. PB2P19]|uniref:hypothetical protein n=1 Tax=Sphingomonas rhamnosi TaxID=3096156 RepID=UPI002FC861C4